MMKATVITSDNKEEMLKRASDEFMKQLGVDLVPLVQEMNSVGKDILEATLRHLKDNPKADPLKTILDRSRVFSSHVTSQVVLFWCQMVVLIMRSGPESVGDKSMMLETILIDKVSKMVRDEIERQFVTIGMSIMSIDLDQLTAAPRGKKDQPKAN